jgi:hypothetical protein
MRRGLLLTVAGLALAAAARADVIPVTNTSDSGVGSFRQAIIDSNVLPGTDTITFFIPGGGVHVIVPLSPLPAITDPVIIDGYTQPGARPNTLAVGDDAVILIVIDGTAAGSQNFMLEVQAANTTIRGLSIVYTQDGDGIAFDGGGGGLVVGNFIGVQPDGVTAAGNGCAGVRVGSPSTRVGGPAPADRNVISSTSGCGTNLVFSSTNGIAKGNYIGTNAAGTAALGGPVGIDLTGRGHAVGGPATADGNVVSGNGDGILVHSGSTNDSILSNRIGTNAAGTGPLGNSSHGILVSDSSGNFVGVLPAGSGNVISGNGIGIEITGSSSNNVVVGNRIGTDAAGIAAVPNTTAGIRLSGLNASTGIGSPTPAGMNVISGNGQNGVEVQSGTGFALYGNLIGTDATGSAPLPNGGSGIVVSGTGTAGLVDQGNVIAFNAVSGIQVLGTATVDILARSIHSNGALGIDLNGDGPTPNDPGDGDSGPNGLQNYPVLTTAWVGPATVRIQGALNSLASVLFLLQFYASPACDGSGFGEGETFLGTAKLMTDGTGNAAIDVTLPVPVALGSAITATANGPSGTSEFSACVTAAPAPLSYYTVPSCRVVDTRDPDGPLGGPALAANAERTFVIAGSCGVPASALAVSANVAVTLETAGGDLRVFPAGTLLPLISTINYNTFAARSNNAMLGLGAAGDVTVHVDQPVPGTVHLILDVNGYFQ